ncbi:MAG: phosphoribosylformylglycinamidine synthase subunit PurS [Streptosporangiales bacterium]|nr:phosphoribosylformylglycinamidine synthase subunit PurS [Streptosporangiales bacterium]MBO0892609.1 phosphoribosylformylglycinamidine synthase subunit PurS [Acidothermales bacterium]
MARVVVDVMLKPELLDPQGQALAKALDRLGYTGVSSVRQGKRFELEVDGPVDDRRLDEMREIADTLLANPVIEDFTVTAD